MKNVFSLRRSQPTLADHEAIRQVWLDLAGGDLHRVEQALIDARKLNGGQTPSSAQVRAVLEAGNPGPAGP